MEIELQEHVQKKTEEKKELEKLLEKVLLLPSPIECIHPITCVPMTFHLDKAKITHYILDYNPKWIQEKKYYLISERYWGIREKVRLYMDESGTEFYME